MAKANNKVNPSSVTPPPDSAAGTSPEDVEQLDGQDTGGGSLSSNHSIRNAILIGVGAIVVVGVFFALSGKSKVTIKSADDAYTNILKQSQMESVKQNNIIADKLKGIDDTLKALQQQKPGQPAPAAAPATPNEKDIEKKMREMMGGGGAEPGGKGGPRQIPMTMGAQAPHLQTKDLSPAEPPKKSDKASSSATSKSNIRIVNIPGGTRIDGIMETGAMAPVKGANSGFKSPTVLIRFTKDGTTANFGSVPLRDAVVLAKADGIWNLERVVMETQTLDIVLPSGKVVEVAVEGQIQGEDGTDGVPGELINPGETGRMLTFLGGSAAGGFLAAMANAQTSTQANAYGTTTNTVNNALTYSLFSGLSNSWQNFSTWYLDQAKNAMPFVVAKKGTKVTVLIQKGVSLGIDTKEI